MGVISEPQVFTTVLGAKDAFIILASDGVWEFIDSQAAVDIVGNASSAEEGCRQVRLRYTPEFCCLLFILQESADQMLQNGFQCKL